MNVKKYQQAYALQLKIEALKDVIQGTEAAMKFYKENDLYYCPVTDGDGVTTQIPFEDWLAISEAMILLNRVEIEKIEKQMSEIKID